jgi:hypothetical protein
VPVQKSTVKAAVPAAKEVSLNAGDTSANSPVGRIRPVADRTDSSRGEPAATVLGVLAGDTPAATVLEHCEGRLDVGRLTLD